MYSKDGLGWNAEDSYPWFPYDLEEEEEWQLQWSSFRDIRVLRVWKLKNTAIILSRELIRREANFLQSWMAES